jgi:hemerythrin-like domain-containing protein
MKAEITGALVEEHRLILRMITLLEKNASLTAKGSYSNWQFYLDGVDFIRNYADRFHHAKEEGVLFEALVTNGMPREKSPVAAMLMEHDQGRSFVKGMEAATHAALEGIPGHEHEIAENALAYAALLRDHIAKEDGILYPLAERLIPETMRADILEGYREAEAGRAANFCEQFLAIVEKYERE